MGMLAKRKALSSIRQARKLISQGQFEEAEELLWEAISVLEKAKDLTRMREAFGILEELQKSRGWEENLFEVYRKWIQRDPENPEVLRALSRFYVRKKDCSPLAIKIYEKTLAFHPDEAIVLTGYAECLIRMGKKDEETLKIIQRATEVDKLWIRGLKYLAQIYQSDPKYARQEEEVNKRLHSLGALDAEGIVRLAHLMASRGADSPDAISLYRESLLYDPTLTSVAKILAKKYKDAPHIDPDIIPIMVESRRRTGPDPYIDFLLARYYVQRGEVEYDIIEIAKNAAYHFPDDTLVAFAAKNLTGLRDLTREAIDIYIRYLEKAPGDRNFLESLIRLFEEFDYLDEFAIRVYKRGFREGIEVSDVTIPRLAAALSRRGDTSEEAMRVYQRAYTMGMREVGMIRFLASHFSQREDTSLLAEDVFRECYKLCEEEEWKELAARGLVRIYLKTGKAPLLYAPYIDFLYRRGKIEEWSPPLVEALAKHYLKTGEEGDHTLWIFQKYLEYKPKDITFIKAVAPYFFKRKIFNIFTISLYRTYYDSGGEKAPELLELLLKAELTDRTPRIGSLLIDSIGLKLPIIEELPVSLLKECAEKAFREGRNSESLALIQTIRRQHGEIGELLYLMAKNLYALGKWNESEKAFKQLKDDWTTQKNYWLGVISLLKGKSEEALKYFSSIEDEKLKPFIHIRKGDILVREGKLKEAEEHYRSLGDAGELKPFLSHRLGSIFLRKSLYQEAVDRFEEAAKNGVVESKKALAVSRYLLGRGYVELEKWEEAVPLWEASLKDDFYNKPLWRSLLELHFRIATRAIWEGHDEKAISHLLSCLKHNYKFDLARVHLAFAYARTNQYDKAKSEFEQILRTPYRDNPRIMHQMGWFAFQAKDPDAIHYFLSAYRNCMEKEEKSLILKGVVATLLSLPIPKEGLPDLPVGEMQEVFPDWVIVSLLMKLGKIDEALSLLKDLLKKAPDNARNLYLMGLCYLLKNEPHRAISWWYQILELPPGRIGSIKLVIQLYIRLGYFLLKMGYTERAVELLERVKYFDPTFTVVDKLLSEAYKQSGYEYMKKERRKEGLLQWEKARKYYPEDWEVLHNLANYYTVSGELKQAIPLWQRLLTQWQKKTAEQPMFSLWIEELKNFLSLQEDSLKPGASPYLRAQADEYLNFVRKANRFYWILGAEKNATRDELERKYFRLIKTYTPEKHPDIFMEIEEAYMNLTRPKQLQRYLVYIYNPANITEVDNCMKKIGISVEDYLFFEPAFFEIEPPRAFTEEELKALWKPFPEKEEVVPHMEFGEPLPDILNI